MPDSVFKNLSRRPSVDPEDPLSRALLPRRRSSRAPLWAGLTGTIVVHLLGLLIIPNSLFDVEPSEIKNPYKEYEIELTDPEEPDPAYTQTNPDVPDNEPDETERIAARNQQAAQETPAEELDPNQRPSTESEDTQPTDQFLSGDLSPPQLSPPPSDSETEPQEQSESVPEVPPAPPLQPLRKEIPVFGSLDENDPDETGVAEQDFEETEETPTNISDKIDGEAEEGSEEEQLQSPQFPMAAVNPSESVISEMPSPRPRPRLPRVAPGPIVNKAPGVSKTGSIAVNARFSEFGEYMERLIETVSMRWNTLAEDGAKMENNSMVKLRFLLNSSGTVTDIELMETTAKAIGIYMCRSAISQGSPYAPWTEEMIQTFGDSEEITFAFYYQ